MAKVYDQPLCLIGSKGKFADCYMERGYLPALESPPSEESPKPSRSMVGMGYSSLLNEMEQLKGAISFLENKLNEHIDLAKQKRKGYW